MRSTGSVSVMKRGAGDAMPWPQAFELGVQRQPAQRAGHVLFLGQVGDRGLGARLVEQRRIAAGRMHGPPAAQVARTREVGRLVARRARADRVAAQPPEEEADVRDVVAPAARRGVAHFGGVRERIERGVAPVRRSRRRARSAWPAARGARGSCAASSPAA